MTVRTAIVPTLTLGALLVYAPYPSGAQTTICVSVDSAGVPENDAHILSGYSVSADGRYVAFDSDSTQLASGDSNGKSDVFVRDTVAGTTRLVSVSTTGEQGNGPSLEPAISANGRFVAFASAASNLDLIESTSHLEVYVRDLVMNTTKRVSVAFNGQPLDGDSVQPQISADGRFVTFDSMASNLVPGDVNGTWDVFVYDTVSGTTQCASVSPGGAPAGTKRSEPPAISLDGRYVAFDASDSSLVDGDTNGALDVFVRDMALNTTRRISTATSGAAANGDSLSPSVSADGRYVTFTSGASDLVAGDTNSAMDVFVRDTLNDTTVRVSLATDGTEGNGVSYYPFISADGRTVTFSSSASNLISGDTNGAGDAYVHDCITGVTSRVSVASDGSQTNSGATGGPLSADGRYVLMTSTAADLVSGTPLTALREFLRGPLSSIHPTVMMPAGGPVKSSPTAFNGGVIFGADDGKLYGCSASDGEPATSFPVDVSDALGASVKIRSRPSVYFAGATPGIFFTTDRGDVLAFGSGGLAGFTPSVGGEGNTGSPAVTPDGSIYVAAFLDGGIKVVKLNPDMSYITSTNTLSGAGSTVSSVAVAGNKVYVGLTGGNDGDIMVLSASDLTVLSSGVATGEGVTAPPYVVGPDMYVGTLAGNFYKLNSSNNDVDTSFGHGGLVEIGEPLPTSPFFNDGAFYAGSTRGKVWKIGLDGSLEKTYDTWNPSAAVGGVVVERNSNTLAFGTSAGDFYKVPLNGGDAGVFGPNLGFETTPTYDASTGRFFIGSDDGHVYGF